MPGRKSRKRNPTRRLCEDGGFDQGYHFAQAAALQFKCMARELELMKKGHAQIIKRYIEFSLAQLPPHVLNMTLEELEEEEKQNKRSLNNTQTTWSSPSFEQIRGRSTGYAFRCASPPPVFHKPQVPVHVSRRSSSQDSYFRNKLTYVTPGISKIAATPITPKVNPGSPVGMLRFPVEGEFAVSASGSPLLVSSRCINSANISIPLNNGKVVSVLPKPGVNTDPIVGNLAPGIRRQLETLTHTLNAILSSCKGGDNE